MNWQKQYPIAILLLLALLLQPGFAYGQPVLRCLVVGDSIAVGLRSVAMQHCSACARGGWNSWQVDRQLCPQSLASDVIVVALGTNDHSGVDTLRHFYALRKRITARVVAWDLPYYSTRPLHLVHAAVRTVADEHGDWVVSTRLRENSRGIHPSVAGYRDLARQVWEIAQ